MCGIAGAFGFEGAALDAASRAVLAHRGPDAFGDWEEDGISLLHWRLSIIDLSAAGNQPMVSASGRFVLCYNGEVYNFQELREQIGFRGWRGRSDTEVILEGCARFGPDFLGRLNGMFALALYDRETRTLRLARDRVGIKPLYVVEAGGGVLFASEAKFFFHSPRFEPRIRAAGLSALLRYGHCYGDRHVLEGVRQLEAGEVLTLGPRGKSSKRSRPPLQWRPVARDDESAAAELRKVLTAAVARQLVADVPLGVLLSGGVDSSILTALSAQLLGARQTMAFTLGYPGMGDDYDEIDHARRVAAHLGVQHYVYEASGDDLIAELERLVWHYDEPFADAAALNMLLISRMIRSRVTVALAGEGSDELFGGYRRYQFERAIRGPFGRALCASVRAARLDRVRWLPRRLQVVLRALGRKGAAARYSSYLESELSPEAILKPEWLDGDAVASIIEEGYRDGAVGDLCLLDQRFWLPGTYLEKSDKGGMAHGLEVRVPFLDDEVVDFANTLPDHQRIRGSSRKWLLKKAFEGMVPPAAFSRFKRGFGVPVGRWLRRELRDYYVDQVLSPGARVNRYLQMRPLEALFREHVRGARDYSGILWRCLVLEIWLRLFEHPLDVPGRGVLPWDHAGRIAEHDAVGGHVEVHEGVRRDQHVVADDDLAHHDRAGADPDPVADGRTALAAPALGLADGDAVGDVAVVAEDGVAVHDDAAEVRDVEALADPRR
jgi:asparagine synthase (glutamine-hydrolysing)